MKSWIISVCMLGVLFFIFKIIAPQGRLSKTAVFVYSLLSVVCIISPVINFDYSDFSSDFNTSSVLITTQDKTENAKVYCMTVAKSTLYQKGVSLKNANFTFVEKNGKLIVEKIEINLSELGYIASGRHINITSTAKEALQKAFNLSEDGVIFYE